MKKKHMYNKTHHIKFPYQKWVVEACDKYRHKAERLSNDHRINNLFVDLRLEMCRIIDKIYQQLSIELKHNISIRPTRRNSFEFVDQSKQQQCVICGEQRVVDSCHIISREDSGSSSEDNMIYLCPNHHFLFDQVRLSKEEFNKINVSDKAEDSIEFFHKAHKTRHQMYWKYGTNKSTGCTCGSLDFDYDAIQNGNFVQPCLVCKKCKKKWFLGANHPLVKEMSIQVYEVFEQIDQNEKEKSVNKAMETLRKALAKKLGR